MERFLQNFDVTELLVSKLTVKDLVTLCGVSQLWRKILGQEIFWGQIVKREGIKLREKDYLMKEFAEYERNSLRLGCVPLCRSFFITVYPAFIKRTWRNGRRQLRKLTVPLELKQDITVCFDVSNELLVIGTIFGNIIVWRYPSKDCHLEVVKGCLEQKIDKVAVHDNLLVTIQNGFLSVFDGKNGLFAFLYCMTFEAPDRGLLLQGHDDFYFRSAYSVPFHSREKLTLHYKPLKPAKFPDQDFSISDGDDKMFATGRVGEREVTLHDLETGNVANTIILPQDLRLVKLAMVQLELKEPLLYILGCIEEDKSNLHGMFYDLHIKDFITHLHLNQQLKSHAGFFSLFTEHGLLMHKNSLHDEDPIMFTFNCWNYLGGKDYSFSFYTEYSLCLAECKLRTLVTPRARNYFYRTSDRIILSQRIEQGAYVICFSGPGESSQLWKINIDIQGDNARNNVLLGGSQAAGAVCTAARDGKIAGRDEQSGRELWSDDLKVEIENLWVGDNILITIPKNFEQRNTVCLLEFKL